MSSKGPCQPHFSRMSTKDTKHMPRGRVGPVHGLPSGSALVSRDNLSMAVWSWVDTLGASDALNGGSSCQHAMVIHPALGGHDREEGVDSQLSWKKTTCCSSLKEGHTTQHISCVLGPGRHFKAQPPANNWSRRIKVPAATHRCSVLQLTAAGRPARPWPRQERCGRAGLGAKSSGATPWSPGPPPQPRHGAAHAQPRKGTAQGRHRPATSRGMTVAPLHSARWRTGCRQHRTHVTASGRKARGLLSDIAHTHSPSFGARCPLLRSPQRRWSWLQQRLLLPHPNPPPLPPWKQSGSMDLKNGDLPSHRGLG